MKALVLLISTPKRAWFLLLVFIINSSNANAKTEAVREDEELSRKSIENHTVLTKSLVIDEPFNFAYMPGSIEKAAFDYAMIARTQNIELLKTLYTKEGIDYRIKRFGGIQDKKYIANARFDKHFSISIRPHILEPENYHVEVKYYLNERQPKFSTVAVMKKIDGKWKIK